MTIRVISLIFKLSLYALSKENILNDPIVTYIVTEFIRL